MNEKLFRKYSTTKVGASYGRVSTDASQSLNQQAHIGKDWMSNISRRTNCFYDIKYVLSEAESTTGKNDNRPEFQHLIYLVINNKIQFVVVKGIDRLARKLKDFSNFIDLCKLHNVEFYVNGLDVDFSTPAGTLVLHLLAAVAEMEGSTILQRSITSIRSAQVNQGKIHGRSIALGYILDKTIPCTWRIDPDKSKIVIYIFETFLVVKNLQLLLKKINELGIKNSKGNDFNVQGLKRLLEQPIYNGRLSLTGTDQFKEIPTKIIDDETFNKAQSFLKDLKSNYKFTHKEQKRIYPLTGIICNQEGRLFKGTSGTDRSGQILYYYRERTSGISYYCNDLESAIIKTIINLVKKSGLKDFQNKIFPILTSESEVLTSSINTLNLEISDLVKKMNNITEKLILMDFVSPQIIKHIETTYEDLNSQKTTKEKELLTLEEKLSDKKSIPVAINSLQTFLSTNEALLTDKENLDQLRSFFRKIFKRIEINYFTQKMNIHWASPVLNKEISVVFETELRCTSRSHYLNERFGTQQGIEGSMLEDLSNKSLTTSEIAKKLRVSRSTISKHQKLLGLQRRKTGSNLHRTRGVSYGTKISKSGKALKDSEEDKIVQAIFIWKNEGKSYRAIAKILNTQQVTTKTGKGTWHGKTIHQIYSRLVSQKNSAETQS